MIRPFPEIQSEKYGNELNFLKETSINEGCYYL